jgi:hypothetical protein
MPTTQTKTKLTVVKPTTKRVRPSRRITATKITKMSVVQQVQHAFAPGKRLAALIGVVLGGFVPMAVFHLVHAEVATYPQLWLLVAGGLLYSSLSVYKWAKQAFRMQVKAIGFVLLLEGTVTFSHTPWLSFAGLAILIGINAISAAVALQVVEEDKRLQEA